MIESVVIIKFLSHIECGIAQIVIEQTVCDIYRRNESSIERNGFIERIAVFGAVPQSIQIGHAHAATVFIQRT